MWESCPHYLSTYPCCLRWPRELALSLTSCSTWESGPCPCLSSVVGLTLLRVNYPEIVNIGRFDPRPSSAIYWYWQGNDGGPIFLVTLQKGGDKKSSDKITAKLDEKMQRSSLHIRASQPSHSGTYLCATVHSGLQTSAGCLQTCSWATAALLT